MQSARPLRPAVIAGAHRWASCGSTIPDIELFIAAKQNSDKLTGFNISVGVTDEFMQHLKTGEPFPLRFEGKVYKEVDPRNLWNQIMQELLNMPSLVFCSWTRINNDEQPALSGAIEATNPCGEQPLPANGACLLGSFNLVKYVDWWNRSSTGISIAQISAASSGRWTTPSTGQFTR